MTLRRIQPPQMLLDIAETGGTISADMDVIGARFRLPRRYASQAMHLLARRKLLSRDTEQTFTIAPKGWAWVESYNPTTARPSSPAPPTRPPPISPAPPPQATRDDDDPRDRAPLSKLQRIRLGKQRKQMRALAKLRGVTLRDLGVELDRPHDGLELGIELGLEPAEYQRLKIVLGCFPVFLPAGFSKDQAKAIRDDFNRPGRTKAKSRSRQAKRADKAGRVKMVADLDCRASAVHMVLTDQSQTMVEIMDKVACSPAFRTPDGNSLLTGGSLKKAIQRAIKEPTLAARVEIKRDRLKNGRPLYLFRRRQ